MPAVQRSIALRGPLFYQDQGRVMFVHHLDGSTRIGPREATDDDKLMHFAMFQAFEAGQTVEAIKPLITFETPEGGEPIHEPGPFEQRRGPGRPPKVRE